MLEIIDVVWNILFLWKLEGNNNEGNGIMWWNKFGEFVLVEIWWF